MKVLVVEDDPSLREGMGELVSELAEVRLAESVPAALAVLEAERFELVLTDLHLGPVRGSGRHILEAARRQLAPVALVSASVPEDRDRYLQPHRPDGLLGKPFQLEELTDLVERFLALRRELERAAGVPPPAAAFQPAADGGARAPGPECTLGVLEWVRLGAEDVVALGGGAQAAAALVVQGTLRLPGEQERPAGDFLYVSAGHGLEVRAPGGCTLVRLVTAA